MADGQKLSKSGTTLPYIPLGKSEVMIEIERGPLCYDYNNIEFVIASACENELSDSSCMMSPPDAAAAEHRRRRRRRMLGASQAEGTGGGDGGGDGDGDGGSYGGGDGDGDGGGDGGGDGSAPAWHATEETLSCNGGVQAETKVEQIKWIEDTRRRAQDSLSATKSASVGDEGSSSSITPTAGASMDTLISAVKQQQQQTVQLLSELRHQQQRNDRELRDLQQRSDSDRLGMLLVVFVAVLGCGLLASQGSFSSAKGGNEGATGTRHSHSAGSATALDGGFRASFPTVRPTGQKELV
jgi:hypothetical protein